MEKINIAGMSCGHCTGAVKNALENAGANNVTVNLEQKYAEWEGSLTKEEAKKIIDDQGFVASF